MSQAADSRKSRSVKPKAKANPGAASAKSKTGRKERVLIEFPSALLQRADEAARGLETNRSDLIRNAVERLLDEMEYRELERELAKAYAANAELNRALTLEFREVDREGF
jgi:Arc/MetJ-type ribon-helix-helix transcriptional regulator